MKFNKEIEHLIESFGGITEDPTPNFLEKKTRSFYPRALKGKLSPRLVGYFREEVQKLVDEGWKKVAARQAVIKALMFHS